MSKIRTIYLYCVCFITLSLSLGGFISTVNSGAQHFFPTSFAFHQSVTDWTLYDRSNPWSSQIDREWELERQEWQEVERQNARRRTLRSTLNSFGLLVVSAPIFIYHWKKAESERKESEV